MIDLHKAEKIALKCSKRYLDASLSELISEDDETYTFNIIQEDRVAPISVNKKTGEVILYKDETNPLIDSPKGAYSIPWWILVVCGVIVILMIACIIVIVNIK